MLTPEDIENREFLVSLRGYDRDEVAAFLGRVAAEVRELHEQLEEARRAPAPEEPSARPSGPAVTDVFGDVARETQRILEAAQEAASNLQRKARQDIDRELQSARSQAARHIAEGERRRETIERVVADLEQRRDQLAEDLRNVGRTIEQSLRELVPAAEPTASVREALVAETAEGETHEGDAALEGEAGVPASAGAEVDARETGPDEAPAAAEGPEGEQPAAARGAGEPPDASQEPAEAAEEPVPDLADEAPVEAHQAPLPPDDLDDEPGGAVATAPAAHDEDDDEDVERVRILPGPAPAREAAPQPEADAPATLEVEAPTIAEAPSVEEEPVREPSAEAVPAAEEEPTTEAPIGEGEADPRGLRAQALAPLHPKLVRRVKRELQELQNVTLDALRRSDGQGAPEAFGPDDTAYQQLGAAVDELLKQAYGSGVASAGTLAGRPLTPPTRERNLGSDLRREAATRIDESVAATLRVAMGAGEDVAALSERVGSVYTELKTTGAEELAATHLVRAYELGLLDTWAASGITHRRWVLGREPRCPEARCRTNDQAGVVPLHDDFPSGHAAPPVHVGCTCTTIPITEPPA